MMVEYIENKQKIVKPSEKIIFDNQCENLIEVGTGLIFKEDGNYIVSVYNGKITVYKDGSTFKKPDEIPPKILDASKRAEEKLKAKADELYEEFIAQKQLQIEQLKTEIEKLKRKTFDYKKLFENPPVYPAYTGFPFSCGEETKEKYNEDN